MINKLKAFSLAELMVTLVIMGILASIMIPTIKNFIPDKNKAAFKKAYYVAERVIYDMVTDESLYPSSGTYKGFDNLEEVRFDGFEHSGIWKFMSLFTHHVNHVEVNSTYTFQMPNDGEIGNPNLITSDGIAWYIPSCDFAGFQVEGISSDWTDEKRVANALRIMVDINNEKGPNKHGVDRYDIYVMVDGRVFVIGDKEKEYTKKQAVTK